MGEYLIDRSQTPAIRVDPTTPVTPALTYPQADQVVPVDRQTLRDLRRCLLREVKRLDALLDEMKANERSRRRN